MDVRSRSNQDWQSAARRRLGYSLAAGAAAATIGASEAGAAINYFQYNLPIDQGFALPLKFNTDTYNDIVLSNFTFTNGNYQGVRVPFTPGKVVGFTNETSGLSYVSALTSGFSIDASSLGPSFLGSMAYGTFNPNAQFNNISGAFIGFAFPIGPTNLYYAWIRVDVNNAAGTLFVHDWAYEDQTGVGILAGAGQPGDFNADAKVDGADLLVWQQGFDAPFNASDLADWKANYGLGGSATVVAAPVPEPGALGLLAAGAGGLAILRRRRDRRPQR